jgi:dihydroxyacetone kinase phosphoprotein-dependent L subunit
MTRIHADPDRFVSDSFRGFALAHRDTVRLVDGGVVRARPLAPGSVAVLIGGGSGHYPAFAGYVGAGMAAGAVCGNIFSSPSTGQALRVAAAADAGGGVLFTFGQYAGDVIHFGEAQRRLRAEGIDARTVLITDDVASAPADAADQRRGIAGVVCVFRVAGAAAERGDGIDEVERLARLANDRTRSHGVAFSGCTLPGADHPLFEVPEGMMSIGLGIHGEPGVRDVPLQPAPELARTLLEPLLVERPEGADRAVVLVNGLGTVKYEELYLLFGYVAEELEAAGVEVVEPECGELVTSLDMAGVSVTLMWLDDELEELWRAPAASPAFRKGTPRAESAARADPVAPVAVAASAVRAVPDAPPASQRRVPAARRLLRVARDVVADNVEQLGALDAVAGDGDHGVGMLRGLSAAVEAADRAPDAAGIRGVLRDAGQAWSDVAGGTSGALWGGALEALGEHLDSAEPLTASDVAAAVAAAADRIARIGGAEPGDKTMVDAIGPFVESLRAAAGDGTDMPAALTSAAEAARLAADQTAGLRPKRGRARPLAERSVGHPDPGATSFALIVAAVARDLNQRN